MVNTCRKAGNPGTLIYIYIYTRCIDIDDLLGSGQPEKSRSLSIIVSFGLSKRKYDVACSPRGGGVYMDVEQLTTGRLRDVH